MTTAHQLRAQIESQLANRIPSALTPAPKLIREKISTGIEEIDELLGGGFPLGAIAEVIGAPSTGRTTLAMSLMASVTASGHVGAWIDAGDEFDPFSAAAIGIVLDQMLLVRCGAELPSAREPVVSPGTSSPSGQYEFERGTAGHGSNHPRGEIRGLDQAVGQLFQQKITERQAKPGTPAARNIPLATLDRTEQVSPDRMPSRRGDGSIKSPLANRANTSQVKQTRSEPGTRTRSERTHPWKRIEQSIRVVDLLLQYGGFQLVVLDFTSLPGESITKVPMATWFRFRSLAESHHSSLVIMTNLACAKSSAALSLQLAGADIYDETTVMTGLKYKAFVERQRFATTDSDSTSLRKPPQSTRQAGWRSQSPWAI